MTHVKNLLPKICAIFLFFLYSNNSDGQISIASGPVQIEGSTVLSTIGTSTPTVNIWDKLEIGFSSTPGSFSNPYDPTIVNLCIGFTAPDGTVEYRNAFWYVNFTRNTSAAKPMDAFSPGGYGNMDDAISDYLDENSAYLVQDAATSYPWRVRFSTNKPGLWSFHIYAIISGTLVDLNPPSTNFYFNVTNNPTTKKLVSVGNNGRYFSDDNGNTVFPIGLNVNNWWNGINPTNNQYQYNRMPYDELIGVMDEPLFTGANCIRTFMDPARFGIEWNETGLGNYDARQNRMYDLDAVFEEAERKNFFLQLVLVANEQGSCLVTPTNPNGDLWLLNPYHTIVPDSADFFTHPECLPIFEQRLRYIIARWDYSTSVLSYEIFNEVVNFVGGGRYYGDAPSGPVVYGPALYPSIINWHQEVVDYCKSVLATKHMLTTSAGAGKDIVIGSPNLMNIGLDYSQVHYYTDDWGVDYQMNYLSKWAAKNQPKNPFFVGEYDMLSNSGILSNFEGTYACYSPTGYNANTWYYYLTHFHNSIWSGMAGGQAATPLYYGIADIWPASWGGQERYYNSLSIFLQGEDLSNSSIYTIANQWPTGFETSQSGPYDITCVDNYCPYAPLVCTGGAVADPDYISNSVTCQTVAGNDDGEIAIFALKKEDKILGWVQEKANYWQRLPYSTSGVCPCPTVCPPGGTYTCFDDPFVLIPYLTGGIRTATINNVLCDGFYTVEFYNTYPDVNINGAGLEDGGIINAYTQTWVPAQCGILTFNLPPFGPIGNGIDPKIMPDYGFKITKTQDAWDHWWITNNTDQAIDPYWGSICTNFNHVVYRGMDDRIHHLYPSGGVSNWDNSWAHFIYDDDGLYSEDVGGGITLTTTADKVFYCGNDKKLQCYYWDGSLWDHIWFTDWTSSSEDFSATNQHLALANSPTAVVYPGIDNKIHEFYWTGTDWAYTVIDPTSTDVNMLVGGDIKINDAGTQIYYEGMDNRLQVYYFESGIWNHIWLTDWSGTSQNVGGSISAANGQIFYQGSDGLLHLYSYDPVLSWVHSIVTDVYGAEIEIRPGTEISAAMDGSLIDFQSVSDFYVQQVYHPSGGLYGHDHVICPDYLTSDMQEGTNVAFWDDGIHNIKTFYAGADNEVQLFSYAEGCNPQGNTAEKFETNHHLIAKDTTMGRNKYPWKQTIIVSGNATKEFVDTTLMNTTGDIITPYISTDTTSTGNGKSTSNILDDNNQVSVYPNPSSSYLNVDIRNLINLNNSYDISICDIVGSVIKQIHIEKRITKISISDLVPDIYMLYVKEDGVTIKIDKIVKSN